MPAVLAQDALVLVRVLAIRPREAPAGLEDAGDLADRLGQPRRVGDGRLVDALRRPQPLVSKHLRVLRDAGAVTATVVGKRRAYRLAVDRLPEVLAWVSVLTDVDDRSRSAGRRARPRGGVMPETNDPVRAPIDAQAAEATLTEAAGRWVLTMMRALRHPRGADLAVPDRASSAEQVVAGRAGPGPDLGRASHLARGTRGERGRRR